MQTLVALAYDLEARIINHLGTLDQTSLLLGPIVKSVRHIFGHANAVWADAHMVLYSATRSNKQFPKRWH